MTRPRVCAAPRRHLVPAGLLMRSLLNGGTLGGPHMGDVAAEHIRIISARKADRSERNAYSKGTST